MFTHPLFHAMFGDAAVATRFDRAAAIDAYRRADELIIHVDLPGVSPESIEVGSEGDWLTITGERHYAPEVTDQVLITERPFGKFHRRLQLGDRLDLTAAVAEIADGVLTLRIPMTAAAKPKRIDVKVVRQKDSK